MKRNLHFAAILMLLIPAFSFGQGLITGRVVDAETKKGIKEADIIIEGTDFQTTTNVLGYFQVQGDTSKSLLIKRLGYETGQIKVPAAKAFQVQLAKDMSAEFQGGMEEFYKIVRTSVTYPEKAKSKNVQGKFYVTFDVDSVKGIQNIKTIKDIGQKCGDEVEKALKKVPNTWVSKTGMTTFIMPVTFQLDSTKPVSDKGPELPKGKMLAELVVNAPN